MHLHTGPAVYFQLIPPQQTKNSGPEKHNKNSRDPKKRKFESTEPISYQSKGNMYREIECMKTGFSFPFLLFGFVFILLPVQCVFLLLLLLHRVYFFFFFFWIWSALQISFLVFAFPNAVHNPEAIENQRTLHVPQMK